MPVEFLPGFFVLGAQKAGTTTLHDRLSRQPEVYLPRQKETHFFSHDERYERGLPWYLAQFRHIDGSALVGEVDPEYLFFPEAAARMRALGLAPRFVVLVREPLDRAYSQYRMSVRRGLEELSFAEALHQEDARLATGEKMHLRHHSYMARGRYTEQIERFRTTFPDSELLVVKFEDLFHPDKGAAEFVRLCRFIGLDKVISPGKAEKKYNPASSSRFKLLNEMIWDKQRFKPFRRLVRFLVPFPELKSKLARVVYSANQKAARSDIDWLSGIEQRFLRQANDEARSLSAATGLDLAGWIRA